MIDIAPPENLPRRRIPPRELIRQKIAEEEAKTSLGQLENKEKPASSLGNSTAPGSTKVKAKTSLFVILSLIFLFLAVLGALAGVGIVFLQLNSQGNEIQKLKDFTFKAPSEFEAQKTKVETLEKNFEELKKAEAEKITSLEDKINQLSQSQPQISQEDVQSIHQLETILKVTDTDGDGLSDYEEVITYGTNPNLKDTDGDKYSDKTEIDHGYNPLGPGKMKVSEQLKTKEQKVISVTAKNYTFDPSQIEAKVGEKIILEVQSQDVQHTFTIDELNINQTINPGEKVKIELTPQKAREYVYYSNTPDDKGKGMMGKLIVKS